MRIAVNCRSFMNKQYTGIGRYASRLVYGLKESDASNQYVLYAPKGFFNSKRIVPNIKAPNFRIKVDRFKRGVKKTLAGAADIFHSPSPDIFDAGNMKVVVTIHDLVYKAFPSGHTQETVRLTDDQMRFLLPKVTRFICCSRNTAVDLKRYFSVADEKIAVIYPGFDPQMFYRLSDGKKAAARVDLAVKGINGQFILYVGTIEPRKNLKNLIKAFSALKKSRQYDGQLIVVGMVGWGDNDFKGLIEGAGLSKDIILLGFLSDEQLRVLYNCADLFVFPSFYEGFGYPIVEAFACGCPVVTSNAASCPEVAGDAAVLVDPHDAGSISEGIKKLLQNESLKAALIERGVKRSKQFDYLNTARQTLEVYKSVYEN